jgi:hypothetical protein
MTRLILGLVAGVVGVSSAVAQPADKPPAKAVVEFRWLEHSPDKALTEDKGIQTTCGPELMYPHKKPVLTNADVAAAEAKNHGQVMGLRGDHYTVTFKLSDAAKKTLAASAGDATVKELATFVDGKYWGTAIYRPGKTADFIPQAGFITSKAEAERIVAAVK